MSKILKNTTLADIELTSIGLTIPASGQITIQVEDYLLLASQDSITELTPLINNGDIVVNNGSQDLASRNAIEWIKYQDNFISANEVYVDLNGSDSSGDGSFNNPFASLTGVKDALDRGDFGTINVNNPLTINIAAGNYSQAPVDFSSYSNVNIFGKALRTRITATNPNADLLTMGTDSGIRSISLTGVTNANNWHVKIKATNGGGFSGIDITTVFGSNGITCENLAGNIIASFFNCLSIGLTGTTFETNNNVTLTISSYNAIGNETTTIGVKQNGSGILYVLNSRITNMDIGVQTNGTGTTQLISLTEINSGNDLDQNGTGLIEVLGGNFNARSALLTDTSKVEGYFLNELPEEFQIRALSSLSVGLPNRGRKSLLGQGDAYTLGMLVYNNSSTDTLTNVSIAAESPTSSTFTFADNAINSEIYISTALDQTNPLKWYGLITNTTTAANLGAGDIVFEYWNGTNWIEFNHMMVDSFAPYQSFANSKFEETGTYQLMFDKRLENNWIANDPISLGVNLYWIRLRIVGSALTTLPVFEQFKIQTSTFKIEDNGFQNMYGNARIIERFSIGLSSLNPVVGRAPNSQDIYLSDNLAAGIVDNSFPPNQNRARIFNAFIPFEVDTSCPIDLVIAYQISSSSSGSAVFRIRWATTSSSDSIYTSASAAPTSSPNERSITGTVTFGSNENQTIKIFNQSLEIPEAVTQSINGTAKSSLWVLIERVTNDPNDNYSGDIILDDLTVFYTAFREGGYSGSFS